MLTEPASKWPTPHTGTGEMQDGLRTITPHCHHRLPTELRMCQSTERGSRGVGRHRCACGAVKIKSCKKLKGAEELVVLCPRSSCGGGCGGVLSLQAKEWPRPVGLEQAEEAHHRQAAAAAAAAAVEGDTCR